MIQIEIDDKEIQDALKRLRDRISDLTPVMRDIGEYLVVSTRERFLAGQAPDGEPWSLNSPATIAAYRRKTGRSSKRPLIGETSRLSREIVYTADKDSILVGSSLKYAAVQQFGARKGQFGRTRRGSPIPWGDIPPRPFLGLSEGDRKEILEIIGEALESATK